MNYAFDSRLGEQLYQLLPELYRTRDKAIWQTGGGCGEQDLARYLDAHGHLLDLIHATLEQQLKDVLPESSQDWLLSYFAQLLATNIVSPDSKGKHAEIAHAVSWRQRKGTLKCAEEIAEAVAQMEVEVQEGWKRLAMTPRIGMPLMPAKIWDDTLNLDMGIPSEAIRHPTLPAAMVDLSRPSRAVEALSTNPAARLSSFAGVKQTWRQANRHGVPCFPNSFDDVSSRTVDIRTPDARNGHYHHKRLLAYAPPPIGLFPLDPIELTWDELHQSLYEHLIEEKLENGVWLVCNKTARIIEITDDVTLTPARPYRVEGLNFHNLKVADGGELELHRVEANRVEVGTFSTNKPVLNAKDCLFNELSVGAGIAKLDSCSILDKAILKSVDAVNCIFNDFEYNDGVLITGGVRYSRIPSSLNNHIEEQSQLKRCSTATLEVFATSISYTAGSRDKNGAGVLRPDCDPSIYTGASDGGEMGYFHNGREGRPVRISGDFTGVDALSLPTAVPYPLADVVLEGKLQVDSGILELIRSAVRNLTLNTPLLHDAHNEMTPALDAKDCLFDTLVLGHGLARLEYCTVMQKVNCGYLQASDCIFVGQVADGSGGTPTSGCVRYSRIPQELDGKTLNIYQGLTDSNTIAQPLFIKIEYCRGGELNSQMPQFGEPGYGVLAPVTPEAIRFGAEDGGEMGVYHHKYYSLKLEAVRNKMREFLPVGIEPVLIQDARLLHVPPEQKISKKLTGNGGGS